ncbi:MAG: ATP-binding protein [Desulfobacteraceae bacterium]|nr:ATP-binding protein [Desulfobacteraceae bacterium]
MAQAEKTGQKTAGQPSDRRLTEIKYHQKLNRGFVLIAMPAFLFFSIFFFFRGAPLSGTLLAIMALNAVVTVILGMYIKDLGKLVRLKQIGTAIAFGLLAAVLVDRLFSNDIYIAIPWSSIYPVVVLLMFGERIGIFFALGFCIIASIAFHWSTLPPWDDHSISLFKWNSTFALLSLLAYSLLAERTRVRMRNHLLEARNKHKQAEERQRLTNEELKSEIAMRVQSERALSQSELRYRALFEESAVSLWEEDYSKVKTYLDSLPQEAADDLKHFLLRNPNELSKCINTVWITAVNRATLSLYEVDSMAELLRHIIAILPSDLLGYMAERLSSLYRNGCYHSQLEAQTVKGRKLHLLVSSTIPAGYEQGWEKVFSSVYDITERQAVEEEKKRVENQVQHTRQIQAVATLAGGIAHQFNNALAVICGHIDLMELNNPPSPENQKSVSSLRQSSERIRGLTEQLLAYARGGKYQPVDYKAEKLIQECLSSKKLFHDSAMRISTRFEDDVVLADSDITQIQTVLAAVLVNAMEAMDNKGDVIIATRSLNIEKDDGLVAEGLVPGPYALITVEDKGVGMDEETRRRIFEPFFTTKFIGRGLGMAAAFGIVRNHNGLIVVDSQMGKGTRVMIYLPRTVASPANIQSDASMRAA